MRPKLFPFSVGGTEYHLRELDQDTKDDILDRVTAFRLRSVERMHRKAYLSAAEYMTAKAAAFVKWGSEALATELNEPDNQKMFVRKVLVETVDDPTLAKIMAAPELAAAMVAMREDDDPLPLTPPV